MNNEKLVQTFGGEFNVLLGPTLEDLCQITSSEIAQGIINAREGNVQLTAGYDGVFGHVHIKTNSCANELPPIQLNNAKIPSQGKLFSFKQIRSCPKNKNCLSLIFLM